MVRKSVSSPRVTANNGVVLTDGMRSFLAYLVRTLPADVPLHVTSGVRTTLAQAQALKVKRDLGDDLLKLYAQDDLVRELLAVPNDVEAMREVLERQVARGRYLSDHMRKNALDLRSKNLTADQVALIERAAEKVGAKVVKERSPPHIHIEDLPPAERYTTAPGEGSSGGTGGGEELVARVARELEIPPAAALALVKTESGFNPRAYRPEPAYYARYIAPKGTRWGRSPIFGRADRWGSYGLTQILASTAYGQGYPLELDPARGGNAGGKAWPSLFDPEFNLRIGLRYFLSRLARYGTFRAALAAYNAGNPSSSAGQAYAGRVLERAGAYMRAGVV